MPQFEPEQGPEARAVVMGAGGMLTDQPSHEIGLEVAASQGRGRQQYIIEQRAKLISQPVPNGDAESHLAAVEHARWQQRARRLS